MQIYVLEVIFVVLSCRVVLIYDSILYISYYISLYISYDIPPISYLKDISQVPLDPTTPAVTSLCRCWFTLSCTTFQNSSS